MSGLFDEFDVIHTYSRRQAIEDGVLVQLSGPGYEGDEWIPAMCKELGFRVPVAMTTAAFFRHVALTDAAERAGNDMEGRLWDVLYMFRSAINKINAITGEMRFQFYCVVDCVKPTLCTLKSVIGPGDDGEPVLTIMLPEED